MEGGAIIFIRTQVLLSKLAQMMGTFFQKIPGVGTFWRKKTRGGGVDLKNKLTVFLQLKVLKLVK